MPDWEKVTGPFHYDESKAWRTEAPRFRYSDQVAAFWVWWTIVTVPMALIIFHPQKSHWLITAIAMVLFAVCITIALAAIGYAYWFIKAKYSDFVHSIHPMWSLHSQRPHALVKSDTKFSWRRLYSVYARLQANETKGAQRDAECDEVRRFDARLGIAHHSELPHGYRTYAARLHEDKLQLFEFKMEDQLLCYHLIEEEQAPDDILEAAERAAYYAQKAKMLEEDARTITETNRILQQIPSPAQEIIATRELTASSAC